MRSLILISLCLALLQAADPSSQAVKELSAAQKAAVERGRQVFVSQERQGSPWPAAFVYQYVDASPEEAAAVFTDYERHASYIPSVKRSKIARKVNRRTVDVDQTIRVPIVADERYTVRNRLSTYGSEPSYRIDWVLVRASSTKAITGHVRFEPYRNERLKKNGTLMAYYNFVTPGSRLAGIGLIEREGLKQMREAASAIVRQIERERNGDRALLGRQISALRTALAR